MDKIEEEILQSENSLQQAMLTSNVSSLDLLLADNLIFTNHFGQTMSKKDDLEAHRSGLLSIEAIESSDFKLLNFDNTVIVSVKSRITGSFTGEKSTNDFRFTRVWIKSTDDGHSWQVAAAHSSIV